MTAVSVDQLVDRRRLAAWLDAHLPGAGAELDVRRLSSGHNNEILELRRGEHVWYLRRPALVPNEPSLADRIVLREFRVLRALDRTDVPHPNALACCEDLDVAGSCFYVMERVDGFTPRDPLPAPYDTNGEARRQLAFELVDAMARLATVDWRAIGLEGFGKPDGFLDRQVDRWLGALAAHRGRELPGLDEVAAWLRGRVPPPSPPGIVHGDLHFMNTVFRPGAPARLAAIVDWELATIGDPLLDLGGLLAHWSEPGEPPRPYDAFFSQRAGLPTRAELVERYAGRTGRDVDGIAFYVVLTLFKQACILEGSYARHLSGASDDPVHATLREVVPALVVAALETARGQSV